MTEQQSKQRKSLRAKAIFGLLPAVVMVGAFATAGAAENIGSPRSGELHVTKECPHFDQLYCTITGSNLNAIRPGMNVVYASGPANGFLNSFLVLDGPGNNDAYGYVSLDLSNGLGTLNLFGGTGRFSGFQANVNVACAATCTWDGTYSFTPPGQDQ